MRAGLIAVGLGAVVAVAAACGGSRTAQPTEPPTSASTPPPATVTTTDTTPIVTTTATPTSSAPAAGTACTTSALRLALVDSQGAGQHFVTTVSATNASSSACTLSGFFGAAGYDGTTPVWTTTQRYGSATAIRLAPGEAVTFMITVADAGPSGGCPDTNLLHVTPPGQRSLSVLSLGRDEAACAASVGAGSPQISAPKPS